jgi:hypothetical protein
MRPILSNGMSAANGTSEPLRAEGEMADTDARLWHPWLRINRVLRVMLHTRWSAKAWSQVRVELKASTRAAQRDPARGLVHLAR